jgi:uncharacterized membrane protein
VVEFIAKSHRLAIIDPDSLAGLALWGKNFCPFIRWSRRADSVKMSGRAFEPE